LMFRDRRWRQLDSMGWLEKLFIGAAAAKTYQNIYNKPIVIPPSGYVVRGLSQRGLSAKWTVKYSKEEALNSTSTFDISRSVTSVNVGSEVFQIEWPC